MTSYLYNWLSSGTVAATTTAQTPTTKPSNVPTLTTQSPPPDNDDDNEDDEGSDTETEHGIEIDEDDSPPSFPSPFSAQRAASSSTTTQTQGTESNPLPKILFDSKLMPPPPLPSTRGGLTVPRISGAKASGSLAVPPTTTKRPTPPSKKREKVALAPGHSPLDWASLKSSGADLRGVDSLTRIPPSVLKQHNKRDDIWSAFNGKVYNLTPYMPFHPGGEKELMRIAGRDGTKLFAATHAWVNVDFMLDACLVGFLVPEPSS